ncbi:hypothetical protein [Succinimonas amylolytica]|uniref:hypothetical protein n=1 Tax=Succinimonas amylolytica TaxID=83769 RepID=UPI00037EA53B|nr:hypothetical protein [Succinimonas amylolytica]
MKNSSSGSPERNENRVIRSILADLSNGADLIIAAYNGELSAVSQENAALFQALQNRNILMDTVTGYWLNPHLSRLINYILKIDTRSYIDTDIAARLKNIAILCNSYIEHLKSRNSEQADRVLTDLTQLVHEIGFDAQIAVDGLSRKLLTEFGFVHSLRDKIAENEAAIQKASDLVDNLTAYTYQELNQYVINADNDTRLYRILISDLLTSITRCQNELNAIMGPLRNMLSRFRQQVRKTSLIKAYCDHCTKNKNYHPGDYVSQTVPPEIFTRAAPLELEGHALVTDDMNLDTLAELVKSIRTRHPDLEEIPLEDEDTGFTSPPETAEEELIYSGIEDDVINFFVYVVDAGVPVSALEYYHRKCATPEESGIPCSPDHWLFAVSSYYDNMDSGHQEFYRSTPVGRLIPSYTEKLRRLRGDESPGAAVIDTADSGTEFHYGDMILDDIIIERHLEE